jgi:RNA-dependent RNA polymerase
MHELTVKVRGLHSTATTYDVWRNFATKGTIVWIQLFENRYGLRDGHAKIRFSLPPKEPFLTKGLPEGMYMFTSDDGLNSYRVYLSNDWNRKRSFKIQSPVKKTIFYDEKMKLYPASLDFGVMLYSSSMMPMKTVQADIPNDMSFVVDLLHHRIICTFKVPFRDPRSDGVTDFTSSSTIGQYDRINRYMFQIPFSQLKTIRRVDVDDTAFALVISLENPPQFLRKIEDNKATHSSENPVWTEFDSWFRQTDIVYDPYRLQTAPVALHKETSVIDIGNFKN